MGGFIASSTFLKSQLLDGLININGSGAWKVSEEIFQKGGSKASNFIKEIKEQDPINYLEKISNRPVLLMHGADDTVISPIGQQEFFYGVQKRFPNTPILLELFPDINHLVSTEMLGKMGKWLEVHF